MRESNEGRRWLEQAEADLDWTRLLFREGAYYLVCFLAQQVAEKALKAILYDLGEELVVGHSVSELCTRVAAAYPELEEHCSRWGQLDVYYLPTRYPDALPGGIPARMYSAGHAEDALAAAIGAVDAARSKIPG
jgi:HEPN domain-containing protein